ncbi:DEAD/DEAH box helicase [Shewanella sedimentimangrovi]|uniref:DEAD/DEAH box helicase n=1 Tax=Shewanella sedimentimangrovi TaxID=2814293 RepID=A0ABX7QWV8_9GAMM|nr:DEAD/DEAH box helicase [Shewanella sedimentimangrovi]QSX35988.1 DEAD/DEAH box helicase [Shewanella sedimentimangrovi]
MIEVSAPDAGFAALPLSAALQERLVALGFKIPTAVQWQAIPKLAAGEDLLAVADTGQGKTAAFALPLLDLLAKGARRRGQGNQVRLLVLVPTRELAQQVASAFESFCESAKGHSAKILAAYGGVSVNSQMLALRGGADVLVATPGRLLDLHGSNAVRFDALEALVLDEADRMLSLGFAEELASIRELLPVKRQTALFSATFGEELQSLLPQWLKPGFQELQLSQPKASTLVQRVITVNKENKAALLASLIKQYDWRQVLVFASAKSSCQHLCTKLAKAGIEAQVFHGDKSQGSRDRTLEDFRSGKTRVLIATDLAGRGIDIDDLPVVINFELPRSPADYMHRIGRSGRAGREGLALSLICHEEYHHFRVIEKKHKLRLEREQIPGFEASADAPEGVDIAKPQAKPEGTGKKKRKNLPPVNAGIWRKPS